MRVWALFTSGHNSVGTGDREYRLRPVLCRGIPPPPARWARGGGGLLLSFVLPTLPPGLRAAAGRWQAADKSQSCKSYRLCLVHPSLIPNPVPYHCPALAGPG